MERQRGERGVSGGAPASTSRCRPRAARGQRGPLLCRSSPHTDNEGWSAGKDVQSSLTVCVPSELSTVSSVTIQLLWPPSAPPLSSWSLSQTQTHTHTHTHKNVHLVLRQVMITHAFIIFCTAADSILHESHHHHQCSSPPPPPPYICL